MKLGDKMTTVEACNVWTDVCTRKTRPPRIGDIPRHVAVDEESPGASSSQLPVSPPPNVTNSVVKPPSGSEGDAGAYPTPAEASEQHVPLDSARPRISNFLQGGPRVLERIIRVDGRQSLAEKIRLNRSSSQDSGICRSSVVSTLLLVKQKLSNTIGKSLESRRTNRPAALRPNRPQSRVTQDSVDLPEAPSSRKDSAVCLEDPGDTDSAPSRREVPILHATPCCEGRKSLPRHIRPRRESSGYFSNLSTFDDDRRCSTTLEAPPGQSVLRERRRSSTRMPTTEVYRKVSTAGLEMPDIQELKEIREDLRSFSKDDLTCLGTVGSLGDIGTSKSRRLQDVLHELSERSVEKDFEEVSERLSQTILSSESVRTTTQNLDSTHRVAEKILTRSDSCRASDKSISASPNSSPRSQRHRKRVVHQYSSPSSPLELERIPEKPQDHVEPVVSTRIVINDDDDDVVAGEDSQLPRRVDTSEDCESKKFLPRPVKVYQLLSTQSEDRGDGEPRLTDRRTSLQICRPEDEETLPRAGTLGPQRFLQVDGGSLEPLAGDLQRCEPGTLTVGAAPVRKLSSPEEVLSPRIVDDPGVAVRPIYPYCPYSPYASPQGSPRNRRRPLRESRRVSIDDSQGALQLNQYKLLDNIGQGSFGIVKLAYNEEDGTHYAMKILSKKKLMKKAGIFGRMAPSRKGVSSPLAKVYREIALLKKLDHPNVVKLVEVLDDPDEDNLYLVFELVERGEVLQLPTDKPLDEETARTNFRDVVLGVEYLHYQRIVHRDIKPSNLLVDSEGHVKIADLGVSAELRASGELLAGCAGTPAFSAPETTIPGAQYSGTLCDVWSMGVTLYTLVTGRVPWDGAGSIIGVQAAVRSEPLRFPEHPQLSDTLRDLISRMLHKDPASRCNLDDIKAHVWLTDDGKHPLPNQADNCRLPVTVTDEEVARVVTRVPKLDTLILIKTMLKQHSFQNPFLPRRVVKPTSATPSKLSVNQVSCTRDQVRHQQDLLKSMRTEEFHRAGRSNSAPDSYDWQVNGRQVSVDTSLPPVTEVAVQEVDVESR